jgi:hypothetical protein
VNEFDPTFLSLPPSLVIDENTAVGTMILSSKPFDEDLDLNGKNQRTKTSLTCEYPIPKINVREFRRIYLGHRTVHYS